MRRILVLLALLCPAAFAGAPVLWHRMAGTPSAHPAPLLFLHGGPGYNSLSFELLAGRRLEAFARVRYLDQRGCGRSPTAPDGRYTLAALVEDLEALRIRLGLERWVVMGHSFGGALALEYAAAHPDRVAGLVVVDGLSDGPASFKVMLEALGRRHPECLRGAESGMGPFARLMAALGRAGRPPRELLDELQFRHPALARLQNALDDAVGLPTDPAMPAALFREGLDLYRFRGASRLRMPVLVLGGRQDEAIGEASMKALAASPPKGRLVLLEDCGHFPYLEQPQAFDRELRTFLEALPR